MSGSRIVQAIENLYDELMLAGIRLGANERMEVTIALPSRRMAKQFERHVVADLIHSSSPFLYPLEPEDPQELVICGVKVDFVKGPEA